ncbi:Orf53 [Heliothis zea nudivirus]|uniref:Orf53 n=1 Tax=Heliothis zea nudivirus 1 TaxID=3116536 RepID=Q8JKQ8_9VIRU|nr:Orf53 [Heliothis zea nudivirus]AAN04347.1 Orf53 [Heliothis zea nudivirus]
MHTQSAFSIRFITLKSCVHFIDTIMVPHSWVALNWHNICCLHKEPFQVKLPELW